MKTVLISGCSSGFGAQLATEFASDGYQVIATMRNVADGEALLKNKAGEGGSITVRKLDVTDAASITACVESIVQDFGRIDVLVNNAGIHLLGAMEDMNSTSLRHVFETNFFGAINLTRAVLPVMREKKSGHIITISSVGSRIGRVADGAYCASKAAVEISFEAMKHEVARFGIKVSVVCPSAFKTNIGQNFRVSEEYLATSPYADLISFRAKKVQESCENGGSPIDVAKVVLGIANDPDPEFRHLVGEMALQIDSAMAGLTNIERSVAIRRLAGIDWWTSGGQKPDKSAPIGAREK